MTWEIFIGISVLISFCIAIATPILKLNTSITKLADTTLSLDNAVNKISNDNEKSHSRIWKELEEQENTIDDLDKRITIIETRLDLEKRN